MLKSGSLVSIVQRDAAARENVRAFLESAGFRVRAYAEAHDFLAQMQYPGPSCVVLEFDIPGGGGLAIQQALQKSDRSDQVVFISHQASIESCVIAMRAGAVDYIATPFAESTLLHAVELALERSARLRSEYEDRISARCRLSSLTRRELSVFKLLLAGMPNKNIGSHLGIAEGTIKIHRRKVMEKTRARSLVDIVLLAQRGGVPFPDEEEFMHVPREHTMQLRGKS